MERSFVYCHRIKSDGIDIFLLTPWKTFCFIVPDKALFFNQNVMAFLLLIHNKNSAESYVAPAREQI